MAGGIQFADFELDEASYELRRRGRRVRLERLPMELLLLLASRPAQLVTREEIVAKLWGKGVFLDIENGINTAVRKLRHALHDDSKEPKYIQTVPAKGYRFIADIRAPQSERTRRVMLAVLPFDNYTGDPAQDYFVDGLTEETICTLGALNPARLGVIARTSAMMYKGTRKSIKDIGRELNVDYILESSVRRDDNRLRISAQLIRVDDQTHIWAENFERPAHGILAVQDELGRAIADQVRIQVSSVHGGDLTRRHSSNADAYDIYLRGRHFWNQRTAPAIRRAIDCFRQALELDSQYALAQAGLADAYAMLPITSDVRTEECLEPGLAAARAAIASDDSCAEAHTAIAMCKFWMEWDWAGGEAEAQHAIRLRPNYALAHLARGHILSNAGQHAAAEEEIKKAAELDPVSSHMRAIRGQLLFQAGRFDDAMSEVRKALVLNPEAWIANIVLGKLHIQSGRLDDAQSCLQRAFDLSGGNTEALSLRGYAYANSDNPQQAHEVLTTLQDLRRCRYVPPYNIAMVYAGLGDLSSAVEWLQRGFDEHDARMVFLASDPKWEPLRGDPRVERLLPSRLVPVSTTAQGAA